MAHPVAQVRAERHATSQIVISFHLLAPPAALGLPFHLDQFKRLALADGAYGGRRFAAGSRCVCPPRTPPTQFPQFGKLQETFGLEPLQQLSALMVLQASTGPFPLQQLADGSCDLRYAEAGKLPRELAHQLQFASAERAFAKGQGFGHVIGGAARPGPGSGTMSRTTARGARNIPTKRVKASLPCCQQVRSTLARICC